MVKHLAALGLLLAAFPASLGAGDLSWGLQAGATSPMGKMKGDTYAGVHSAFGGPALGVTLDWAAAPCDSLRLRLAQASFGPGEWEYGHSKVGATGYRSEYSIPQVGLDWRHHGRSGEGWHTVLGLALAFPEWECTSSGPATPMGGPMVTFKRNARQNGKLAGSLGAGYAFSRRLYVEGTFHAVGVDQEGDQRFGMDSLLWFQLVAGIRFGGR
jgi:hypothetical protein